MLRIPCLVDRTAPLVALHRVQDGWTALHHASRYGHLEVVNALLGKGAAL